MATSPPDEGAPAEAARVAQLVNAEIRKAADAEVLSHGVAEDKYGFMCDCGCGGMVEIPLALYDAEGAWIDGHRPT
jgi:hypothetical protein